MVKQCYVLNCGTGRKSCKEKASLFRAPRDEHLLEIWRQTVPQKERILLSTDRICEKHFEKHLIIPRFTPSKVGDFYEDHTRPKLAPNAIPTIFQNVDENDPRIKKYEPGKVPVPLPKKNPPNSTNLTQSLSLTEVEVLESDHIRICFRCLIGDCAVHSLR